MCERRVVDVKRAATPEELAADPLGSYWLGETQLVWCLDASTCGSAHWGQPTVKDAEQLTRALELSRHPSLAGGFEVFMDASGIEHVAWEPFTHLFAYVRSRLDEWGKRIRKQAVIVPGGPAGALLAGMVPLLGMTYPMRFFGEKAGALEWLAWQARKEALDTIAEMKDLADATRGLSPTVQRLRTYLDTALADPTLRSAASALGISTRTLQRELKESSTSFTGEVHAARVRAAIRLLEHTDDKIEVIARAVGCASASQLSSLFRRHVGETPARYRARLAASRSA